MAPFSLAGFITLLLTAATTTVVHAHSHLAHIIINGALYHGFDPRPNQINYSNRVAWYSANADDGFVAPRNYSSPEIICHVSGAPPKLHAPVRAGERVHVQWNGWPQNHAGPILTYLAPCTGTQDGCGSVDKTSLRWTKIDDSAPVLVSPTGDAAGPNTGTWSTNVLIARNNSWQVEIPKGLKPGPYVLRQEIIALHFAKDLDRAQNYPLCMNLWVDPPATPAASSFKLDSFDARSFYKPTDKGVLINISSTSGGTPLGTYVVPGPTVAAGARPIPHASQAISLNLRDGTPVAVTRATQTVQVTTTGVEKAAGAAVTKPPAIRGRVVVG